MNFFDSMKYIHYIVSVFRFLQHLTFIIIIYTLSNNVSDYGTIFAMQIYVSIAFILVYFMYFFIVVCNKDAFVGIAVSTNRNLIDMLKLELVDEIEQMIEFGYVYSNKEWIDAASANIDAARGHTSLILLCKHGKIELAQKILTSVDNINVNEKDLNEMTALMWASHNGHIQIVEKLITEYNANVNEKDNYGMTAMMWASKFLHTQTVKTLVIKYNANLHEKDNDGKTAFDHAKDSHNFDMLETLKDLESLSKEDLEHVGV